MKSISTGLHDLYSTIFAEVQNVSKVLTLENTKRNFVSLFVFCSLNRTFDLSAQGTFARKGKEKRVFLLHFARLIVPL